MNKTIKRAFLVVIAAAALCAGTVSARQLRQSSPVSVCGSGCTKKIPCANVVGCACIIPAGGTVGSCLLVAAKPAK